MVSSYNAGLEKSNFTDGSVGDVGAPPVRGVVGIEDSGDAFRQGFLQELQKVSTTMESLYAAVYPLSPGLADMLLDKAFNDLRQSIKKIAADFSLGMYQHLSAEPQEIVQEEPTPEAQQPPKKKRKSKALKIEEVNEESDKFLPDSELEISVFESGRVQKNTTATRSGPVVVN